MESTIGAGAVTRFSDHVAEKLKFYVYRLIDPRNGETFYVGKGAGNRVFAHVRGELGADDDALTEKLQRIRQIRVDGFEVAHVIHRHGMTEDQAFEVEAALIDAYPEVTNQVGGRASDDRGLMHARQVVARYEAPEATFKHRALLITINRSAVERESLTTRSSGLENQPGEGGAGGSGPRHSTRDDCWSFCGGYLAPGYGREFSRHGGRRTRKMGVCGP